MTISYPSQMLVHFKGAQVPTNQPACPRAGLPNFYLIIMLAGGKKRWLEENAGLGCGNGQILSKCIKGACVFYAERRTTLIEFQGFGQGAWKLIFFMIFL
jgi:hypothetical protein